MTEAILLHAGERPILRFERFLERPVGDVWHAVTDPDAMRSWFPTRVVIDEWRVGAEMSHVFENNEMAPMSGTVLEWEPQRRVAFTWGDDVIAIELHAKGDGTNLVLTDELGASSAARNAAGWEVCLQRLESGAAVDWQSRFDHYVDVFQPVLGDQAGPPH